MKVPQWVQSCYCASVTPFICTWCVSTSSSSQVNPFHHLRKWRQTSETLLHTLPNFCRRVAITVMEIKILPAPLADWPCWPSFPGSLNTPSQPSELELVANKDDDRSCQVFNCCLSRGSKALLGLCLALSAGESSRAACSHTPASASHGLLGLPLCSETCFPGGEVSCGAMASYDETVFSYHHYSLQDGISEFDRHHVNSFSHNRPFLLFNRATKCDVLILAEF